MWETIKKEWQAKAAIAIFLLLTAWWIIGLTNPQTYQNRYFGDFPSIYGVMALWGGIWGTIFAGRWGGAKSVMGKAILMFALGLFAQELGQIIYAYYSFYQGVQVPYPSLGDIGYFGSIPLYIAGVWYLAKASGVKIKFGASLNMLLAIIVPLCMVGAAYLFFLQGYELKSADPIKVFLDFGYPIGQAIYISLAIITYLLSRHVLGGIMKNIILFILFALLIQFIADFTFLYQSSKGIWAVGGINDYMYLTAYFLMTLGLIQFKTALRKLR
jgi:hypothetical protein